MSRSYSWYVSSIILHELTGGFLLISLLHQIGKTSSLVLTLCGVLKDILLVAASMIIWQDPVSPLQFFGYSIALGGLVYYKLGAEQIKTHMETAGRQWAELGVKHSALRKAVVFGVILLVLFVVLGGLAPSYGGSLKPSLKYLSNTRKSAGGQ